MDTHSKRQRFPSMFSSTSINRPRFATPSDKKRKNSRPLSKQLKVEEPMEIKYGGKRPRTPFSELPEKTKLLITMESGGQQVKDRSNEEKQLSEDRSDLVAKLEMKARAREQRFKDMSDKKEQFGRAIINFTTFVEDMEKKQARATDQFKRFRAERHDLEKRTSYLTKTYTHHVKALQTMRRLMRKYSRVPDFFNKIAEMGDEAMKLPEQMMDRHATLTINIGVQMKRYMQTLEKLEAARDLHQAMLNNKQQVLLRMRNEIALMKNYLYHLLIDRNILTASNEVAKEHEATEAAEEYTARMAIANISHILIDFRPFTRNKFNEKPTLVAQMEAIGEVLMDYTEILGKLQNEVQLDRRTGKVRKAETTTSHDDGVSEKSYSKDSVATTATHDTCNA